MNTRLRKALIFTLHIDDHYRASAPSWLQTTLHWIKAIYMVLFTIAFAGVVASYALVIILTPEQMNGAWDRATGVALVALAAVIATVLVMTWSNNLTAKRDRLREQVAQRRVISMEIPAGEAGDMLLMGCPACRMPVPINELPAHLQDHMNDLQNPIHSGTPVAALLRRPGAVEWEKIPVISDGS